MLNNQNLIINNSALPNCTISHERINRESSITIISIKFCRFKTFNLDVNLNTSLLANLHYSKLTWLNFSQFYGNFNSYEFKVIWTVNFAKKKTCIIPWMMTSSQLNSNFVDYCKAILESKSNLKTKELVSLRHRKISYSNLQKMPLKISSRKTSNIENQANSSKSISYKYGIDLKIKKFSKIMRDFSNEKKQVLSIHRDSEIRMLKQIINFIKWIYF